MLTLDFEAARKLLDIDVEKVVFVVLFFAYDLVFTFTTLFFGFIQIGKTLGLAIFYIFLVDAL